MLLIAAIPIYYFINAGKGNVKNSPDLQTDSGAAVIAPIKDSIPAVSATPEIPKKLSRSGNPTQQPQTDQPVIKAEEKPVVKKSR